MRKPKLISKCQTGQKIRNLLTSGLVKLRNAIRGLQNITRTITDWGNTAVKHNLLDEYGKPIMLTNKTLVEANTSPAQDAAILSVLGHTTSLAVESIPYIGQLPATLLFTNGVDVITTIPDAFFDGMTFLSKPSAKNAHSVLVDIPEIFPGHTDDVAAWEGFADDLNLATNGKVDITLYNKAKKLVPKANK